MRSIRLFMSIWDKEELPEEWTESIILPICKKGDKTNRSHYRGIQLLQSTYKILSDLLLSRLTAHAEEIIGDHQCGFRRNRWTTDHIFCISQILEKNGSRLRVFEKRVLRRIFWPKKDGVAGEWRKLHDDELMISTPHPISLGWSNRKEWEGRGM